MITVAVLVGKEVHSLLLGETIETIRNEIQHYLETHSCILQLPNLWAINHKNSVMLAIKAELKPDMVNHEAVRQINAMEQQIKQNHDRVQWVFF